MEKRGGKKSDSAHGCYPPRIFIKKDILAVFVTSILIEMEDSKCGFVTYVCVTGFSPTHDVIFNPDAIIWLC